MKKKILILFCLFILCLSFSCVSFADTELINIDIADSIIENAKGKYDLGIYDWLTIDGTNITTALNLDSTSQNLVDAFNTNFKDTILALDSSITKDNLSVITYVDENNYLRFSFVVSRGFTNVGFLSQAVIKYNQYNVNIVYKPEDFNQHLIYCYTLKLNTDGTFTTVGNVSNQVQTRVFNNYQNQITFGSGDFYVPNLFSFTKEQAFLIGALESPITNYISAFNSNYYIQDIPSDNPSGDYYYYNYDYNEFFLKPYVDIDNENGLAQIYLEQYGAPFSVFSQSGDEYYPFDSLKLDLIVYSVEKMQGEDVVQGSVVDSYKLYSGEYATTDNYYDVITNDNILRYRYDLKTVFESSFVDQYLNYSGDIKYAYKIILYDFWGNKLNETVYFYFDTNNPLNSYSIIGGNNINFNGQNINTDFNSLINTFRDFLSTILSFIAFLPAWLISLITLGVTVAIAIRVFGR